MAKPDFGGLFRFFDWVMEKFDAERAARRQREELRKRAGEIIEKHRQAMRRGRLSARDQQELADIMRLSDAEERCQRLVEFDERTRRR